MYMYLHEDVHMTEWYTCAVSVDMKGMGTKAESQNLKDDLRKHDRPFFSEASFVRYFVKATR